LLAFGGKYEFVHPINTYNSATVGLFTAKVPVWLVFALAGTLTGLAAVIHTARLGAADPNAGVGFDAAVAGLPPQLRGMAPPGLPYSPWQLLEHLRITQHDILDFCRNPGYEEMSWPEDY